MLNNIGNTESVKEYLEKLIDQSSGSIEHVNTCSVAFNILKEQSAKQRDSLLTWFIERAEKTWCHCNSSTDSEELKEFIQQLGLSDDETNDFEDIKDTSHQGFNDLGLTEGDIFGFHSKYKDLIESVINMLSCEGMPVQKYYGELFKILLSLFETRSAGEQGYCLYAVIVDNRTPYVAIKPGIKMSNDEYHAATAAIEPQINKMVFILNLSHSQRTETASQLLSVMDELDSVSMKSVFLSQLLVRLQVQRKMDPD